MTTEPVGRQQPATAGRSSGTPEIGATGRESVAPIVVAGIGLIAVAAINLVLAALPADYRETRFNLDGLGSWPAVAAGYGLAVAFAFLCYVVAWRQSRRLRPTRRNVVLVCAFPLAAALLLFPTYPLLSRDFFYTVMNARIMAQYHQNPFQVPPGAFPADPFLPYADWHELTNPYGPLWALIVGGIGRLTGSGLLATFLAFKALFLTAYLGATCVLGWFLHRFAPDRLLQGLVLWAWNPLVLVETVANGHQDAIMLALILVSFACALEDLPTPALLALVMAGDIKQTAFGLLPLLLVYFVCRESDWRRGLRRLIPGVLTSVGFLAVLYATFWAGWKRTTVEFAHQIVSYIATPTALARLVLQNWFPHPGPAIEAFALAMGALIYAYLLRRVRAGNLDVVSAAFGALLVAILIWPVFYPWYVLWLVAIGATLAPGRASRSVIALSAAAGLSYLYSFGLRHALSLSPDFWSAAGAVTVLGALVGTAVWSRLTERGQRRATDPVTFRTARSVEPRHARLE